jgi:hypothetical protein
MKYIFCALIVLFLFTGCKKNELENINIKFTHQEAFDSNYLKRNENKKAELIITKKTKKGIQIIVEKYETGGLKYYGNAKIIENTLFLYYWINIDSMDISAVLIPKRFIYEIKNVSYNQVKFENLGNKFENNIN